MCEIKEVLKSFQEGYAHRAVEKSDEFVKQLFVDDKDTYVLGTATGELFIGTEQIKQLIKDDWTYWGDVSLDYENANISINDETACIAVSGTVKYCFEDTQERYDRYGEYIKNIAKKEGITAKQKAGLINWTLSLNYHQRVPNKREYFWPLRLSGILIKDSGRWKFIQLHFSVASADFPDERFESSIEFAESFKQQSVMLKKHKNHEMSYELKALFSCLEKELFTQEKISEQFVQENFTFQGTPYIISGERQWYFGVNQIKEFFEERKALKLEFNMESSVVLTAGETISVMAIGLIKQSLTEEAAAERSLNEIFRMFDSDMDSKEKLFRAHRSVAYALKESASGAEYTCPIRMTAVVSREGDRLVFQSIHFSFPFYWIAEGKLD